MQLVRRSRSRLATTLLLAPALTLAVLVSAARGVTESESYYLALGDSIAYGVQPTKMKPGARPADFKTASRSQLA